MESPEATAGGYPGLSPLMSSILELTREIENLDEGPLVQGPRKVLWAKKRFPRQGIRCKGATRAKRRKYIGATAKDFPACILNKSAFTSPVPNSAVAPLASETFRREGSAETSIETESSTSEPDRSVKTLDRVAQAPVADQEGTESLSGRNDDCYSENNIIGDEIDPQYLATNVNADSNALDLGGSPEDDDDDASSNRAVNISDEDDQNSVYSNYSTRNDEISIAYHCDSTVSYQEGINYDVEAENFDHVNTGFEVDHGHVEIADIGLSTTEDSYTRSSTVPKRIPKNGRALKKKIKRTTDSENLAVAGPSSQDSGSVRLRSCRKTRTRSNVTMARGSGVCRGGKKCLACTDTRTTKKMAPEAVVQNPSSDFTAPQRPERWTKKEWDDFFCVFSAVAAEAHTLQSLGSNNVAANKRWLGCMRTLLQKPPF